jgi:DNA-binding transcriptional LysR family regulator
MAAGALTGDPLAGVEILSREDGSQQELEGLSDRELQSETQGQTQSELARYRHADDADIVWICANIPRFSSIWKFTDNLVDVIDGGYNAVIRYGEEQTDSRLISRRLGSYRLEIVGSPSYFGEARHPDHAQ